MNFFETLAGSLAEDRNYLFTSPIIDAALRGEVTRAQYVAFLKEAYFHVKQTVPLMMACGSRLAGLLLNSVSESRLAELRHGFSGGTGHIESIAGDLTTPAGRQAVVDAARAFPGGINVLVNNAGINRFGKFAQQETDSIERIAALNFVAPMLLTRDLLPLLLARDAAVVANVGSIVGSIGVPGQTAYSGSKFALHGFSEALRRELAGGPVRVVYIAPRSTDTPMNDETMRFVTEQSGSKTDPPSAVARHIADAIAGARRERFIGWPERLFVKVNALLPALVDRALQRQNRMIERAQSGPQPFTHQIEGVES